MYTIIYPERRYHKNTNHSHVSVKLVRLVRKVRHSGTYPRLVQGGPTPAGIVTREAARARGHDDGTTETGSTGRARGRSRSSRRTSSGRIWCQRQGGVV